MYQITRAAASPAADEKAWKSIRTQGLLHCSLVSSNQVSKRMSRLQMFYHTLARHGQAKKNIRAEFRDLEPAPLLVHLSEGREADGAVIRNNDQQLSELLTPPRPLTWRPLFWASCTFVGNKSGFYNKEHRRSRWRCCHRICFKQ